jgi:hypothetical protein
MLAMIAPLLRTAQLRPKSARRANHFGFSEIVSSPEIEKNQKYFAFAVGQISDLILPVSPDKRGGS